jgi:hypothetical protein
MSSKDVVACYRLFAAYCVETAQRTSDTARKVALLGAAQSWGMLADHLEKHGITDAAALVHNSAAPDLDEWFADPAVRLRIRTIIIGAANGSARPR